MGSFARAKCDMARNLLLGQDLICRVLYCPRQNGHRDIWVELNRFLSIAGLLVKYDPAHSPKTLAHAYFCTCCDHIMAEDPSESLSSHSSSTSLSLGREEEAKLDAVLTKSGLLHLKPRFLHEKVCSSIVYYTHLLAEYCPLLV